MGGADRMLARYEHAWVPLAELQPYARNSRTHSDAQVAQLAASIREFGFTNPVLVDEVGEIIAGHWRVLAAQQLGLADVPVVRLAGLSEQQRRAYVIADNKLALNAGWDDALLAEELQVLAGAGYEMGLLGFTDAELAAALDTTQGLTDPDAVPPMPADPVTKLGDTWVLGRHLIVCGDCTDASVVDKALAGIRPHLMVTDPPYGVSYDPTRRSRNLGKAGSVVNDDRADWREAWKLFPGDVAYVWHASLHTHTVLESLEAAEFERRSMIVWVKDRFTLGRGHYQWQHEPAWYVVRRRAGGGHWAGGRAQSTVWSIPAREDSGHGHGTQKPVECMKRPIENNSSAGQAVYEPFSGSGTTIIAAEMTGRACHAIELSPAYVDVAVIRWQNFTGKQAVHAETGRAFGAAT